MVCGYLDFHFPVSISILVAYFTFTCFLDSQQHTRAPDPPTHPGGKVVISRQLHGRRDLPGLFPLHLEQYLWAGNRLSLLDGWMDGLIDELNESH